MGFEVWMINGGVGAATGLAVAFIGYSGMAEDKGWNFSKALPTIMAGTLAI